eukprot:COSAG01_NODE_13802_length_1533_cov_1.862622_1_plen_190_part_00
MRRRGPPLCPASRHTRHAIVCWGDLGWHGGGRGDGWTVPNGPTVSCAAQRSFYSCASEVLGWRRCDDGRVALHTQVDIEIGSLSKAFSVSGHARGPPMLGRPVAPVPCRAVLSALALSPVGVARAGMAVGDCPFPRRRRRRRRQVMGGFIAAKQPLVDAYLMVREPWACHLCDALMMRRARHLLATAPQ